MMRKNFILFVFLILSVGFSAQKKSGKIQQNTITKCFTVEYEKRLQKKYPKRLGIDAFENWMNRKISERKSNPSAKPQAVVTIPVVVHVINNGEAVGTGTNISDAQVISQITVLNNDYRKKSGTRGYNTNPVGADTQIEFALAVRDPNGNPTNGIDRISYCQTYWDEASVEGTLKPQTIWDPTKYLNIWVTNFGGDLNGILGYAQMPSNSTLQGLDDPSFVSTANTDGVIIGYKYFGSLDYNDGTFNLDSTYGYGRTLTHEVGHWLGLRHIWGDANCGTDYVADTPVHEKENYGCPSHPKSNTCGTADEMFENYMDYTDDTCMNLFTINQKDRFDAVLANSPRRKELLSSNALTPVTLVANDGEVKINPFCISVGCSKPSSTIRLINRGNNNITTAQISINDNGVVSTKTFSGNIAPNKEALIPYTAVSSVANANITASVSQINSAPDGRSTNNSNSTTYSYTSPNNYNASSVTLSLQLDYWGSETSWNLKNSGGTVLYSGGPYTDTQTYLPAVQTFNFNLANNACYTFTISDSYGDGICCSEGNGYYKLATNTGTIIVNNASFTLTEASTSFILGNLMGTSDSNSKNIKIFPNPVSDFLNVLNMKESTPYQITNAVGQIVNFGKLQNGKVSVENLEKGIYFINFNQNGDNLKVKFIKK